MTRFGIVFTKPLRGNERNSGARRDCCLGIGSVHTWPTNDTHVTTVRTECCNLLGYSPVNPRRLRRTKLSLWYPQILLQELLERFRSKALRMIVDAPRYVPNTVIRRDLQIPTVTEEIRRYSSQYSARLSAHPIDLIVNIMEQPDNRRLRRHLPNDLPTRFLV
jgi:hypothetical protein